MSAQPVPNAKPRYRKVVVHIPMVEHLAKLMCEADCALARFKEAKAELKEARRDVRRAKHSCKQDRSVTHYQPVRPGEPGYEDLPDSFDPKHYEGEVRWVSSPKPPAA